jgi:hypothetical protein
MTAAPPPEEGGAAAPPEGGAEGAAAPAPRVNVLYAVLALLPELGSEELEVVRAELSAQHKHAATAQR